MIITVSKQRVLFTRDVVRVLYKGLKEEILIALISQELMP
jgi:hypothetical protein